MLEVWGGGGSAGHAGGDGTSEQVTGTCTGSARQGMTRLKVALQRPARRVTREGG